MAISHNYGITDFPIPSPRGIPDGWVIETLKEQFVLVDGATIGGVTTLNGLAGPVSLTSTGGTIAITPSGSTINLESSGSKLTRTNIATTGTINNQAFPSNWLNYTGSGTTIVLTGVVAQADGTQLVITCDAATFLLIPNQSASSTAANRFITPISTGIKLYANQSAVFAYDGNTARWRFVSTMNNSVGGSLGIINYADGNGNWATDNNLLYNTSLTRLSVPNIYATSELDVGSSLRLLFAVLGNGGLLYTKPSGFIDASNPSDLFFDPSTGKTGFGTSTPAYRVSSIAPITTVADPTVFNASLVAESLLSAPSDSLSLYYGPQDNGSDNGSFESGGSGYTNNDTVQAQLYSYVNVGSVLYTSPSGITLGPITLSNNPSAIQWQWTTENRGDGSAVDGYIIIISDSTTSTTYSYDVGNTTSYFDDNVGGSAPLTPFGGFTASGQTFNYDLNSIGTSPSGGQYFNDNSGSNIFSITDGVNNGSQFWVSHTISGAGGIGGNNWREVENSSAGFDGIGDGQFYEKTAYSGSATITPQHYGIQATGSSDLNSDFEIYSHTAAPIYSTGFLTASTSDPNDSNYYSISLNYTTPTALGKVIRQINSGGFNTAQNVTGGAFSIDALGPAFSDTLTVSPTSSPNTDSYFENSSTSKTVPITIFNANISGGVPTIEFQSNGTQVARLYSTGSNLTTDGTMVASVFNGSGANLTSLNGSNISSGTVATTVGGTGLTSYTQGDLLYSSASNTLSKLAKNTSSTRYLSNTGTSNNPAWAQISLTTGVTGTLPVANGGTGTGTALTQNQLIYPNSSGVYTSDPRLIWSPTAQSLTSLGVVSVGRGTGNLPGTVSVTSGGTTITGVGTSFLSTFDINGGAGEVITLANGDNATIFDVVSDTLMDTDVWPNTVSNTTYTSSAVSNGFHATPNGWAGVGITAPTNRFHVACQGFEEMRITNSSTIAYASFRMLNNLNSDTNSLFCAYTATSGFGLWSSGFSGEQGGLGTVASGIALTLAAGGIQRITIAGTSSIGTTKVGIGIAGVPSNVSAILHIRAGSATAGTAPLKFTSGTLLTTAEAGGVEFLTDKWYCTITTGAARKEFALNDSTLTSGKIPEITTNGRLKDSAGTGYMKVSSGAISYISTPIPVTDGGTGQSTPVVTAGSFSGVGTATTTFTVTIGATQANNTYKINASPTNLLAAAVFYINNKTTTTFDVVYIAGLTGTVTFDWSLFT